VTWSQDLFENPSSRVPPLAGESGATGGLGGSTVVLPPGAAPAGPTDVPAERHAVQKGRGWLLPIVIAVAAALILGGVGVVIGLLTQQERGAQPPQPPGPDQTGRNQPSADGDVPFRGFVLQHPSLEVRAKPVLSAPVTGYLPHESQVFIVCTTIGDFVEGPGVGAGSSITTPVWDKVRSALDGADLGFVPDAWVKTGTAQPRARAC
jgi:hypothetical protein